MSAKGYEIIIREKMYAFFGEHLDSGPTLGVHIKSHQNIASEEFKAILPTKCKFLHCLFHRQS